MSAKQLEDLAEQAAFLPEGWLDDELHDVVMEVAMSEIKAIQGAVTLEQLEFLHMRGFSLERLRELIEEAKGE